MTNISHCIGVDISQLSFMAAVHQSTIRPVSWTNGPDGFRLFEQWLKKQDIHPEHAIICLENTGVYGEAFSYHLAARGWRVAIEPAHTIKKAMSPDHRKSDEIDSRQIAEYAFRYLDRLHVWTPPEPVIEQLQVLLGTREQYVEQMTAHQNHLAQIQLKVVRTPLAEKALAKTIEHIKEQIKRLDEEAKNIISQHPTLGPTHAMVMSIPGVGFLLAANLLLMTRGFTEDVNPRRLASRLGICPHPSKSGTCLDKKDRSRRYGNPRLRKLLHLAAMSLRTHNSNFKHYFLRKVEEGKPKMVVLNNIANKLLRIICAIVESKTPFIDNYKSVNPMFIKAA